MLSTRVRLANGDTHVLFTVDAYLFIIIDILYQLLIVEWNGNRIAIFITATFFNNLELFGPLFSVFMLYLSLMLSISSSSIG
jgi:hypothetical protein